MADIRVLQAYLILAKEVRYIEADELWNLRDGGINFLVVPEGKHSIYFEGDILAGLHVTGRGADHHYMWVMHFDKHGNRIPLIGGDVGFGDVGSEIDVWVGHMQVRVKHEYTLDNQPYRFVILLDQKTELARLTLEIGTRDFHPKGSVEEGPEQVRRVIRSRRS